jgi:hypothetical protein
MTMTIEDRYVIGLDDLKAVRVECACGAAVTIPTAQWMGRLTECPACNVIWMTERSPEHQALFNLAAGLRGAMAVMKDAPFKIRLEIDRLKSPGDG